MSSAVSTVPSVEVAAARGPAGGGRRRRRWTRFVLPVYSWIVIIYLVIPIAVMIVYSFNRSTTSIPQVSFAWNGFTTEWYRQWNGIPGLTPAFWLSIRLGILSSLIATVLGTLMALALVRYRFRGKGTMEQVLFMNIAAPEIVMGAALLGLFIQLDTMNALFHFLFTPGFTTLLISHVMFSIAYVAVTVRARLSGFDRAVEEAAADLGANAWVTFRKVTLPLIFPGILAGALMAFALSVDDFVTSNFVSGPRQTFPLWVYGAVRVGIPPQVFVFGTFIFTVGLLLAIVSIVLQRRKA